MRQSPEIQGIRVIPHDFLTQFSCLTSLCFPQFGFAGLMVAVKDNTWPTRVIFNEVIEIAVGLVEQAEERLFVQEREEVLLKQEDCFFTDA